MIDNVAVLVAVRHWPDVAARAVESIRRFYGGRIVMVDDASPCGEKEYRAAVSRYDVEFYRLEEHRQHGLALDFALSVVAGENWIITCDHDVTVESVQAFDVLLERRADDVGAVGRLWSNNTASFFGHYVHPYWALWNAKAIRKHRLSFAGFMIEGDGAAYDFATAQFLCYRMATLGRGSGEKGLEVGSLRLIGVDLSNYVVHRQVWQRRGDTWKKNVKSED